MMKSTAAALALCLLAQDRTPAQKLEGCKQNLQNLWKLQMVYMSQFGGRMKNMPAETGGSFWLALTRTQPPLVDERELEILICPFSKEKPRPGFTTYRGPARLMPQLTGTDPIGTCEPGTHPDGTIWVLLKSGDVVQVGKDDAQHERYVSGTIAGEKHKVTACTQTIQQLTAAIKAHELDLAVYPPSGNAALVKGLATQGAKKAPYFEFPKGKVNLQGEFLDPFGKPYQYFNNVDKSAPQEWKPRSKASFDLYSFGPNGKDDKGDGDDIGNW